MKIKINFTKLLALVTAISVIISICLVVANASSGTVYESEDNNSMDHADETSDDKDNYGKISSVSDVDVWEITFSEEGMANIWLGDIPTNCNYDIFICYKKDNGSTEEIACSERTSNKDELMKCHVYPGYTYYVFVHSFNQSYDTTNQYKLRIKNYPLDGGSINGKLFYADYTSYSTAQGITNATSELWSMGFDAGYYRNNTVGPAYSVLPNSTIFVTANKGFMGQLYFHDSLNALNRTTLYAKPPSSMLSTDRAITSLASGGLSSVYLTILMNPYSGGTHSTYGNLVDEVLNKGAFVCLGWNCNISAYDQNNWLPLFFSNCTQHKSLSQVIDDIADDIAAYASYTPGISNPYHGTNSKLDSLSIS